ncbi:putative lipoprotein precursor [Furfurilactobacillus rossiae]|nr:zinc-ribbon domain-containing protein [Furfurilactobacillus rossiae]QLE60417.1 putative lipoprotein precursor [Furfurilactobacillus rossiae]QLE63185.1 putative lipoprotein precursor [Furfurilactobacillus rossiae]
MKKCVNCGHLNPDSAKFCQKCGTPLTSNPHGDNRSNDDQNNAKVVRKHHGCLWLVLIMIILLLVSGLGYWLYDTGRINIGGMNAESRSTRHDSEASSLKKENERLKKTKESITNTKSTSSSSITNSSSSATASTQTSSNDVTPLSSSQKSAISSAFTSWASHRAQMGNMAVSDWYFDHGSAGDSDWVAMTSDGKVLVQDNGNPGSANYKIQAIGGVVFYSAKDGTTGLDSGLSSGSNADGYSTNMSFSKPISKYLLANNGVVYELKIPAGTSASPTTGFTNGEGAGDGNQTFQVSQDNAAQNELKQLISQNK